MAHKNQDKVDIQKLIERSEKARETITEARLELRNKLDVAGRMREAVTSEPVKLVGGTVLGGYLLKKIFFRKKKAKPESFDRSKRVQEVKKERNFLFGILALGMAVAKPVAKFYATKLVKDYFRNQMQTGVARRPGSSGGRSPY